MNAAMAVADTEQSLQQPDGLIARDAEDDAPDTVRSLPASMIRSYGISDSAFPGPSAFGPAATAIGNIHMVAARAERRLTNQPLDDSVVQEQIDTHVSTSTQRRLTEQIARYRLAYQSGPPGSGRLTAALVALAAMHEPDRITQLWLMDDKPLHSYFAEPDLLRRRFGHVVQLADAMDVEPSELAQLSTLARKHESSVVLIGAMGRRDRKLTEYLVEHDPPSAQQVFLRWLDRRLRDRGVCVGQCGGCDGGCVQRYVDECRDRYAPHLSAGTMTDAVRFAEMFAEKTPHDTEAIDLLADWSELRVKAVTLLNADGLGVGEHRLRRLAQHQRAARIAFAVFDGYPLTRVFEATDSLLKRIDEEAGRRPLGRTVLEHDLNTLVGDMRVRSSPGGYDDLTGAARLAQLRQPGLVRTILDVVWHEFDSARRPLLLWLDDLVVSGDELPAAAAAGLLCGYDFGQVYGELLQRWAASDKRARRAAAALACEMAVRQRKLAEQVHARLREWINSEFAYLRDTAVRTYATDTFLTHYPLDALSVFETSARDDLQRLSPVIPIGVERIYRSRPLDVMNRLMDWAGSDHANQRTMAGRCLVPLADLDVSEAGQPVRPSLLWLTHIGQIPVDEHAALWPFALLHPATAGRAWSALERWIDRAAGDPETVDTLRDLLTLALRLKPVRTRAIFHVRHFWRNSMPDNPLLNDLVKLLED